MSTLRKKSSRRASTRKTDGRTDSFVGDVTIHDFANLSRTHTKFKKAMTNVSSEVKQAATIEEEATGWSESDERSNVDSNEMHKSDKNDKGMSVNQRRRRKAKSPESDREEVEGIDYPLDVWFIISEYISPEAVGKFARICKSAYHVTTTGKFWFHLYKSYYSYVPNLPERLKPQCMVRTYGLRACVIRTLHYTYFELRRKADGDTFLGQEDPHSLVKRRCCLMWHKESKVRWYFFFKLKKIPKANKNPLKELTKSTSKKTDFLEMLEDVAVNPEEDCKMLMVTCQKYSMLPPVTGLVLQKVTMTLMPGFKDHRLQLGFGTSVAPNTLTSQVILNDVISCRVLDWWHPIYPHQDAVTAIELPECDSWE